MSVGLGNDDVAVTVAAFTFLTLKLLTPVREEGDLKPDRDEAHDEIIEVSQPHAYRAELFH